MRRVATRITLLHAWAGGPTTCGELGAAAVADEHPALPGQKLCTTPRYDLWRSCVGDVPIHRSLASRVIEPTTDLQATPENFKPEVPSTEISRTEISSRL